VQHELFPLDRLEPESVTVRTPASASHQADATTPLGNPTTEMPESEPVADDAPLAAAPDETSSEPTIAENPLPPEIASADPKRQGFPLGLFVAGMSVMSLLLAVIALIVGIHASRTRTLTATTTGEDVILTRLASVAAGVDPASVALDAPHKRLQARAIRIPGADLSTYQVLERRVQAQAPDWAVTITPPLQPVPMIRFADGEDDLSASAKRAVQASAWAARRWGFGMIGVPGLVEPRSGHPLLPERRAQAVAYLLGRMGTRATSLPAEGPSFRLRLPWPQQK
jgi:hypothetical protein